MLEIFQNFESAVGGPARFAPLVLIIPGLAAIIVGLFVWLGGLRFRRPLVALLGAIAGGFCGFFLISRNFIATALAAGLMALIAIIFERLIITILLAVIVAACGLVVLLGPYIQSDNPVNPGKVANKDSTVTISQSIEILKAYAVDFIGRIKSALASSQMPLYRWAIIAALVVIFAVAGFWLQRLASALCYAVLGTLLIFAGMILLLLYKGSAPITKIAAGTSFYAAVFIGMTAFGTLEQLLLCRYEERKSKRKKRADKDNQDSVQTTRSWRTT